jgi:hypothetical protein
VGGFAQGLLEHGQGRTLDDEVGDEHRRRGAFMAANPAEIDRAGGGLRRSRRTVLTVRRFFIGDHAGPEQTGDVFINA